MVNDKEYQGKNHFTCQKTTTTKIYGSDSKIKWYYHGTLLLITQTKLFTRDKSLLPQGCRFYEGKCKIKRKKEKIEFKNKSIYFLNTTVLH